MMDKKIVEVVEDVGEAKRREAQQSGEQNLDENRVFLVETFYISSKKNTVFQVRLTEFGLVLRKETNGTAKEQTIQLSDIIGCRCLRSKRKQNGGKSCTCSALPSPSQLKVVEANSGEQDESDASAYLYIYAYILKRKSNSKVENSKSSKKNGVHVSSSGRRDRTTITLRFRSFDKYEDNNQEAQKWRLAIKGLINNEIPKLSSSTFYVPSDLRKTLILLNPKSGSGKAREMFQQRVVPILVEAEVNYDLYVTKYSNYAREFVRTRDVYNWKRIVVVGGDGIYFEVLNGICERTDWEKALETVPIGIIPCGSGNGLAKTISHIYNEPYDPKPILGATLTIVRGQSTPMDIVRVENKSQIMFSFLSVGWGLIADIDIESERLRAIGGQRFTIWSVHRLISLRTYKGRVSYIPIPNSAELCKNRLNNGTSNGFSGQNGNGLKHSKSYNTVLECPECRGEGNEGCEACDMEFGEVLSLETTNGPEFRSRLDSWYSVASKKSSYFSTNESIYQSVHENNSIGNGFPEEGTNQIPMYGPAATMPALTAPVDKNWTVLEGDFVMVHAAYQTHLGSDCYFATSSDLNDGIIWLCIIRGGVSRAQLLSFLLGLSSGSHIPNGNEFIEMVPCTAFRIEPQGEAQGNMVVDGEVVEYGPIQGEIFPGVANVIVPAH